MGREVGAWISLCLGVTVALPTPSKNSCHPRACPEEPRGLSAFPPNGCDADKWILVTSTRMTGGEGGEGMEGEDVEDVEDSKVRKA